MKRKLALLAALLCCLFSEKVFSQDWIYVGTTTSNDTLYVRSISMLNADANIKVVWEKSVSANTVYYTGGKKRKTNRHALRKIECDCANKKTKLHSVVVYSAEGEALQFTQFPEGYEQWRDIVPETIGEAVLNKICELF